MNFLQTTFIFCFEFTERRPKEGYRFQLVLAESAIDYICYPLEMF